ncbi:hypothetical protein M3182_17450 [Mesobacillus maritimus]|nr:hypothetical protein [Mesobacillus maritimus]MCM3587524.1 hypothetical protein [Mesobacillus maritimus]MCM3671170.1 hypothetical protein [Mesobacillus maritimus]
MLGLWLTLIGSMTIFFVGLYFFFIMIKSAMNAEDSRKVDKLPENDTH